MAIDITGANAYFAPTLHARSDAWTRLPQANRIAAIAHAARLIASRLTDDLETDTTEADDFPRHDAAVYEQALWMLESDALAASIKESVLNPKQQGGSLAANLRAIMPHDFTLAPTALRHLVLNPRSVRMARG